MEETKIKKELDTVHKMFIEMNKLDYLTQIKVMKFCFCIMFDKFNIPEKESKEILTCFIDDIVEIRKHVRNGNILN